MTEELLARVARLESAARERPSEQLSAALADLQHRLEVAAAADDLASLDDIATQISGLESQPATAPGPWWVKGGGEVVPLESLKASEDWQVEPLHGSNLLEMDPRVRLGAPHSEEGPVGAGPETGAPMEDTLGKGSGDADKSKGKGRQDEAVERGPLAVPPPWWTQGDAPAPKSDAVTVAPPGKGGSETKQPDAINYEDSLSDWAAAIGLAPDTTELEEPDDEGPPAAAAPTSAGPTPLVFNDEDELLSLPDLEDAVAVIPPIASAEAPREPAKPTSSLRPLGEIADSSEAALLQPIDGEADDLDDFYGGEEEPFALDLTPTGEEGDAALAAELAFARGAVLGEPTIDEPLHPPAAVQNPAPAAEGRAKTTLQGRGAFGAGHPAAIASQQAAGSGDDEALSLLSPLSMATPGPEDAIDEALAADFSLGDNMLGVDTPGLVPTAPVAGPVVVQSSPEVELDLPDSLVHTVRAHFYEQLKLVKARRRVTSRAGRPSTTVAGGAHIDADFSPPEEAFLSALEGTIRGEIPATEPPPTDAPWETMDGDAVQTSRRRSGSGGSLAMIVGAGAIALMLAVLALPNLPFGLGAADDDPGADGYKRVISQESGAQLPGASGEEPSAEEVRLAREVRARGKEERKKARELAALKAAASRPPSREEIAEARHKELKDLAWEAEYARENFDYKGAVALYEEALDLALKVPDASLRAELIDGARTAFVLRSEMILKEEYLIPSDCKEARRLLIRARELGAQGPELQGYLDSAIRCYNAHSGGG